MDKQKERIEGAYASSIDIYDDILTSDKWWARLYRRVFWGGLDDVAWSNRLLATIPKDQALAILDVPCGNLAFTAKFYASLPLAKITCVDYSPDMLRTARARVEAEKLEQVELLQGDVGKLPFADGAFDQVMSMNGFHAFPDKEAAFSETARVLKKGGLFAATFYLRGELRTSDWLVRNVLAKKGWFSPPFPNEAELRAILERYYDDVTIEKEASMVLCTGRKR